MRPTDSSYRPDVDGQRAIAVLAVLAFHAFPNRITGGFVGVDVFFVISGYLITGVILREELARKFSLQRFYAKRIRRIFPALLLVLCVTLIGGSITAPPIAFESIGKHVLAGVLFLSNILLWQETGYFDVAAATKPLLHLWSLGVEEQYYLVWPALLTLMAKRSQSGMEPLLAFVIVIAVGSFVLNIVTMSSYPSAAFYSPFTRVWEILAGASLIVVEFSMGLHFRVAAGDLEKNGPLGLVRKTYASTASLVGLGLILFSITTYDRAMAFPGWNAVVPVGGTLLVVAAGSSTWINRQLLSNRVVVFIGLISYPLYLWHWPLLVYVRDFASTNDVNMMRLILVATLAVSFGAAVLTYLYIECPLRDLQLNAVVGRLLFSAVVIVACSIAVMCFRGGTYFYSGTQQQLYTNLIEERAVNEEVIRSQKCFLSPNQTFTEFENNCKASGKTAIFLWGDSHAAHLYYGLKNLVKHPDENLSQYTASACPPILNWEVRDIDRSRADDRKYCKEINSYVATEVRRQRPDLLIMAASWWSIAHSPEYLISLGNTIEQMKGVTNKIILVGPAIVYERPQSTYFLPKSIYEKKMPADSFAVGSNEFLANQLLPKLTEIDRNLREIATRQGIDYVSPIQSFCGEGQCRILLHKSGEPRLLSLDSSHLTRDGSQYYVHKLIEPLLIRAPED
jgi:peptidoglycan/LPS O-acetylase OafA/YrhL